MTSSLLTSSLLAILSTCSFLRSWSLVKIGTTTAQKKLFFNLKKLKNQIAPQTEGDLKNEHVNEID